MYEETIAGLRKIVHDYKGRLTPYMRLTICEAADAIEELAKYREESTEWDVTCDPEWRESHFETDEWGQW